MARLVTLIWSDETTHGRGDSEDDPVRRVVMLHTTDGRLVAAFDTWNQAGSTTAHLLDPEPD